MNEEILEVEKTGEEGARKCGRRMSSERIAGFCRKRSKSVPFDTTSLKKVSYNTNVHRICSSIERY